MRVFHLTPHARLPADFQTSRLSSLLDPEAILRTTPLQMSELLAPLNQQSRSDEQTFPREHRTLQSRQVIRRQTRNPALDDTASHFGLADRHDTVLVEDGLELDAGPDGGIEEADDGLGRPDLDLAQRLRAVHVHLDLRGVVRRVLWRPAEQSICVEVSHHHRDDLLPRLCVPFRFRLEDVLRPRHHRGYRDVVVFESLLRRFQ